MASVVLAILGGDGDNVLRGHLLGSKNIKRTRKSVEGMMDELGCYATRAYKSSLESFDRLHQHILPELEKQLGVKERKRGATPNSDRLSADIRFFSGSSIYDIMLSHGLGLQSVYESAYAVVNAVNNTPSLVFNVSSCVLS
jgi:hypothetical protein